MFIEKISSKKLNFRRKFKILFRNLSKIISRFNSNFAKMVYRKFSQKKYLFSTKAQKCPRNFVRISRKWFNEIFVFEPHFEWLTEISRKRLNENLETLPDIYSIYYGETNEFYIMEGGRVPPLTANVWR